MNKFKMRTIFASFIVVTVLFSVLSQNFDILGFQSTTFKEGFTKKSFEFYKPSISKNPLAGREDVKLNWDDYTFNIAGDDIGSNYTTARRPVYYNDDKSIKSYGEWEIRGKYGTTINVLSIYPNVTGSNGLESWMNAQSAKNVNVDIKVTTQSQADFNSNPYRHLKKDKEGAYNYDVIVFGFWDEHAKAQLAASSANIIQDYIDAGYGVIFGHDTVQIKTINKGFNDLVQNNLDIFLTERNRANWYASNKISVIKQGSLTTYPFDINGMDLEIPMTHTVAQFPGNTKTGVPNDDIVYIALEPNYYPNGEGPYFNYNILTSAKGPETKVSYKLGNNPTYEYIANGYLIKQDNVAYLQAGHTSGKTSEAEQMVIANVIYSLAQLSAESSGEDQLFDDVKPSKPVDTNGDLIFESKDSGVGYEYRILATPIGFDMSTINEAEVIKALSTNVNKYNDSVVFSNSYISNELVSQIKGSPGFESENDKASYRYYINKNRVGQRVPTIEVPGSENLNDDFFTLGHNELFNYKNHYSEASKIADDDYLHVVAYDRANNASDISSIRLKDFLKKVNVRVNYSYDGKVFKSEQVTPANNSNLIVGSKYTSTPPKNLMVDGVNYTYSHSEPKNTITLSAVESENVINHIYKKLVAKDVYLVEVRPSINGENNTKVKTLYNTETAEVGKNIIVSNNVPDLENQNFDFVGWSQGTEENYNNYVTDEEFIWTDDKDNIYLYFVKQTATVEVEIVREDGKEFDTGISSYVYSIEGYLGEKITVTGSDITSKVIVRNSTAFSNRAVLQNYKKEFTLKDKDTVYKDKIILKPRIIEIVGIGITYEEEATTSSAIKVKYDGALSIDKNLFRINMAYDKDIKITELAPPIYTDVNGGSSWKNFTDEVNGEIIPIDFSSNKNIEVTYYRGVKPEEAYRVTANYLNILDDSSIADQYESGIKNVANSSNVPVYENLFVSGIVEGKEVEFDIEYYEITHNNVTTTYDSDFDLNDIIPYRQTNGSALEGEYNVNIYYRPYAKVIYTEEVYDVTGTQVIARKTTIYNTLYNDETKSVNPSQSVEEYSIEVSDNGKYVDGEISTTITDYETKVTTKYIPIVYNLVVEVIGKTDETGEEKVFPINLKYYNMYEFKNIPIKNSVKFTVPNYEDSGYYFQDAIIVLGNDKSEYTYDKVTGKISFKPIKNEGVSGLNYKMNLNYRLLAEIVTRYTLYRNNQAPFIDEISSNAFIGDKVVYKIPETEKYELTNAYLDGKEFTNIETGVSYKLFIDKAYHYIELIFNEIKYLLDIEVKTVGGEVDGEGKYYAGEKVYVKINPDEGYKLDRFDVIGTDIILTEEKGMVNYYYFIMPETDFRIDVHFTIDDTIEDLVDIDKGNPFDVGDGNNNSKEEKITPTVEDKDSTENVEIIDNIEDLLDQLTQPKPPLKPEKPTDADILNLVNDPYYSLVRKYKVYIEGYPDRYMRPANYITRGEVMTVIYNLYGNGYVTDGEALWKFDDVNSKDWFANAVGFALDFGIIVGYPDGTFRPNETITREELATIIAKFVDNDGIVVEQSHFSDVTTRWSLQSIEKLYRKDIINGYSNNTFMPTGNAKRSEFVMLINRLIGRGESYNEIRTFPDLDESHWAYAAMMNAANGSKFDLEVDREILSKIND